MHPGNFFPGVTFSFSWRFHICAQPFDFIWFHPSTLTQEYKGWSWIEEEQDVWEMYKYKPWPHHHYHLQRLAAEFFLPRWFNRAPLCVEQDIRFLDPPTLGNPTLRFLSPYLTLRNPQVRAWCNHLISGHYSQRALCDIRFVRGRHWSLFEVHDIRISSPSQNFPHKFHNWKQKLGKSAFLRRVFCEGKKLHTWRLLCCV